MIVIFDRIGYHYWLSQAGLTMMMLIWSFLTFFNTLPIIENSGKPYGNWYLQSCWNAHIARLWGYGRQAMYRGSWFQSLKANRSKTVWKKCLKATGQNSHLLLLRKFRDLQSAIWFLRLGIYSAAKCIFV